MGGVEGALCSSLVIDVQSSSVDTNSVLESNDLKCEYTVGAIFSTFGAEALSSPVDSPGRDDPRIVKHQ
jgi:hypothetical protein